MAEAAGAEAVSAAQIGADSSRPAASAVAMAWQTRIRGMRADMGNLCGQRVGTVQRAGLAAIRLLLIRRDIIAAPRWYRAAHSACRRGSRYRDRSASVLG